jgi:hypothetical protein
MSRYACRADPPAQDALETGASVTQLTHVRSATRTIGGVGLKVLAPSQQIAALGTRRQRPRRAAMSVIVWGTSPGSARPDMRERKPPDSSGKRDSSRRSRRVAPRKRNSRHKQMGDEEGSDKFGKRREGVKADSSFHLCALISRPLGMRHSPLYQ